MDGNLPQSLVPVNLEDEIRKSYLDYAMSVIIGRALPDARDGLKPVHRRILYGMHELGNTATKAYKKCARIVGDVIGKYHPHGDAAVYDALVRMAQDFSMRYALVDGQGNFGCFTGDTKIKLLDGTERTLAELATLPPDEIFYVYSVDANGRIVVGEGRYSRITRSNAALVELTFDDGSKVRCTPDHKFMLRDGSWKQAQYLTLDDSLMTGYFDTASINDETRDYLRVRQPKTGNYEFVHRLADEYNEQRNANWIPNSQKALAYFKSFDELLDAAAAHNHRVVNVRWLDEHVDVYDITVNTHHNFMLANGCIVHNSIDGDPPAAYRYTEARMARIAEEMLADVEKETVDFVPNYDNAESEPTVLPTRVPMLLVNGSAGIAVGMATNIPPHNLAEVVNAAIALVKKPAATVAELMHLVPGPDFPTAGFIYGRSGIRAAYETGRGIIQMRARAGIEEIGRDREAIVITEIPYQVNKAKLIEKIADLVQEKKLEDVSDIRDESDREGLRIVVELKRDAQPQIVLNNLYKLTPMQSSFGVIMLAIVGGQPKVLNLKEALQVFIAHRHDVVTRRTQFELAKAEARAHILAGLTKALDHLDMVIALIRGSRQAAEARAKLVERFEFTAPQADAILEMRLQRLTGLERDKIADEYGEVLKEIAGYRQILTDEQRLREVIVSELEEMRDAYGDKRRTEIVDETGEILITDLVPDEEVVVTISHSGYIKRTPASTYRSQGRGGKGRVGMSTRTEDFIEHMFVVSTHSYILVFTDKGRVYWLKAYEIPDLGSAGKGKALVNLVNMEPGEKIADVVSVRGEFEESKFVMMATRHGTVKKTNLAAFSNPRSAGIIAISLEEGDELIAVKPTDGSHEVLLATRDGMAIRFKEEDVRDMGRAAHGVRGASLREGDWIVAMETFREQGIVLAVTERGYGKRTSIDEYRLTNRGGKGVINIRTSERNGHVVDVVHVDDDDGVLLITAQGKLIRLQASDIRQTTTRSASGVKLIDLEEGDYVASVAVAGGADAETDLVM